jgi:putative GTP pyrophosphokinase
MSVNISKTQIDRLGDRLKEGAHTESDLRLLEDYRRSFGEAYEAVLRTIRERGESPTGRLGKSTRSIAEKLRRESIRLSQMQDIAGCRVVVANLVKQDQFVESLKTDFAGASVIDRRDNPSYGYRAVHVIAMISGKPVEIQVRTSLQHLWAELSEKSSDVLDPTIKYGGGPAEWQRILINNSETVALQEEWEKKHYKTMVSDKDVAIFEKMRKEVEKWPEHEKQKALGMLEEGIRDIELTKQAEQKIQEGLAYRRNRIADSLKEAISWLDKLKGPKQ